jgi:molybdopterin converting factor small subunit
MCIFCLQYGQKLLHKELPSTNTTFKLPKSIKNNQEKFFEIVQWETIEFISKQVREFMPVKLVPLQTTGDGNCLLHALSRAMWGVELFWELLRKSLHEELQTNLDWYKKISAEKYEEKEFDQILHQASEKGQHLQFIHVFAMANVLKRPIIIYGSDEDIERYGMGELGVAALFLPTRHGAQECQARPLALAWSSNYKNHYVPLVMLEGEQIEWPLLEMAFKNTLQENEKIEDYLRPDLAEVMPEIKNLMSDDNMHGSDEIGKDHEASRDLQEKLEASVRMLLERRQREMENQLKLMALIQQLQGQDETAQKSPKKGDKVVFIPGKGFFRINTSGAEDDDPEAGIESDSDDDPMEVDDESDEMKRLRQDLKQLEKIKKKRENRQKEEIKTQQKQDPADMTEGMTISEEDVLDEREYDVIRSVAVSNRLKRPLGFNVTDNPEQVAMDFCAREGLGQQHSKVTIFVRNNQKYFIDHPEAIVKKKIRDLLKPGDPLLRVLEMNKKYNHFPFQAKPLSYNQGKFEAILAKLLSFNDPVSKLNSTLALDETEIKFLERTVASLQQYAENTQQSTFMSEELNVIWKLLQWPADKVFPALDILRILVLHQQAAMQLMKYTDAYFKSKSVRFVEMTKDFDMNQERDLLKILLNFTNVPEQNIAKINFMLGLKFVSNLFVHMDFVPSLRMYQDVILDKIVGGALTFVSDKNLASILASVLLNYSVIFFNSPTSRENTDAKIKAANLAVKVLKNQADHDTVHKIIVALGTLLLRDTQVTRQVISELKPALQPWTNHTENEKIKECVVELLDVVRSQWM